MGLPRNGAARMGVRRLIERRLAGTLALPPRFLPAELFGTWVVWVLAGTPSRSGWAGRLIGDYSVEAVGLSAGAWVLNRHG